MPVENAITFEYTKNSQPLIDETSSFVRSYEKDFCDDIYTVKRKDGGSNFIYESSIDINRYTGGDYAFCVDDYYALVTAPNGSYSDDPSLLPQTIGKFYTDQVWLLEECTNFDGSLVGDIDHLSIVWYTLEDDNDYELNKYRLWTPILDSYEDVEFISRTEIETSSITNIQSKKSTVDFGYEERIGFYRS